MELATLKRYRKIVPGTTFLLFIIPVYQYFSAEVFQLEQALQFIAQGYGSILVFIIGTFFSSLKIRAARNASTYRRINENIKTRLIKEGLTKKVPKELIDEVKSGKELMHIFYYFIDNDESLKEKSKLVRDNGLTWTSTADIAILGCLFSWVYYLLLLVMGLIPQFVLAGLFIGFIGLLSGAVLHPMSVKNHIALGNEQIDFIVTNHKKELQRRVNGIFSKK